MLRCTLAILLIAAAVPATAHPQDAIALDLDRRAAAAWETLRDAEGIGTFREWLLADATAAADLLHSGAPPTDVPATVQLLFRIWRFDNDCVAGVRERLAIAVALEHATPVIPWSEWGDPLAAPIDPVARYSFYRDRCDDGTLFPCFASLPTWEMRRVVDIPLYDDDVAWFHTSLPRSKDGKDLRSPAEIGNAMWLIPYRERNERNGRSVHEGKAYYDGKRWTPPVMLEYGGVCGAVAKFGSFAARAFGVPAQPIGQPGHCALAWKSGGDRWITGNCGGPNEWAVSNLHGLWGDWSTRAEAIPLFVELMRDPRYLASMRSACEGDDDAGPADVRARLLSAVRQCPANAPLWFRLVESAKADPTLTRAEAHSLAIELVEGLAGYPQLALDAIASLEERYPFAAPGKDDGCGELVLRWARALEKDPSRAARLREAAREWIGWCAARLAGARPWGPWRYPRAVAVYDGAGSGLSSLVSRMDSSTPPAVREFLVSATDALVMMPELAEAPSLLAVRLAEHDESLRPTARSLVERVIAAHARLGNGKDALALARQAILTGERMADGEWIGAFTDLALSLR